ncbi:MAG: hypothetical protein E7062_03885 [Spirochaetaceae bacterium]|nr:hypothetical protein [Spirochaetaceae bacterium]
MKKNSFVFVLFFVASFAFSLTVPAMNGPVNDLANLLSQEEREQAFTLLQNLNDTTGIQIALLTIPTLQGEDLEEFSLSVAESWKLGQEDKDTGALLFIALAERSIRIEVGYGLEDSLTDMQCGKIIREIMVPEFQQSRYSQGIIQALQTMVGIASGEIVIEENSTDDGSLDIGGAIGLTMFMFCFCVIVIGTATKGRFFRKGNGSVTVSPPFIATNNHSDWSSWDDDDDDSHGGFSGGGGDFGGGGASGGW